MTQTSVHKWAHCWLQYMLYDKDKYWCLLLKFSVSYKFTLQWNWLYNITTHIIVKTTLKIVCIHLTGLQTCQTQTGSRFGKSRRLWGARDRWRKWKCRGKRKTWTKTIHRWGNVCNRNGWDRKWPLINQIQAGGWYRGLSDSSAVWAKEQNMQK